MRTTGSADAGHFYAGSVLSTVPRVRHLQEACGHVDEHRSPADGVNDLLQALCLSVTTKTAVLGATVHLSTEDGSEVVVASSDDRCTGLDELQLTTGEGPAREAFAARRPVLVPDLRGAAHRWPTLSAAASPSGIDAVFAFPLHVDVWAFGVLDLYVDHVGPLSSEHLTMAQAYAQIATDIVLDGDLADSPR